MPEIESRVLSGGGVNEDLVRTIDDAAIILDGATGLSDRSLTAAASDGRWYVETLADALETQLTPETSLETAAEHAVADVADQWESIPESETLDSHEEPSGAGALLRWTDDELEYLVLGDCSVLIQTDTGTEAILGEGPRELDEKVVDRMQTLQADADTHQSHETLREAVHPLLVKHRKLKNQPGGYWAFGLDPAAVSHATAGSVPLAPVAKVAGFTDGFEPLCPTYDAFAGWAEVLDYLDANGLDRAIEILRAFEASDPDCHEYPRLKPSDDVGLATITWG